MGEAPEDTLTPVPGMHRRHRLPGGVAGRIIHQSGAYAPVLCECPGTRGVQARHPLLIEHPTCGRAQVLNISAGKTDIDSFVFEDFELVGYQPHKKIAMELAV